MGGGCKRIGVDTRSVLLRMLGEKRGGMYDMIVYGVDGTDISAI
jgi:hypothetical protein